MKQLLVISLVLFVATSIFAQGLDLLDQEAEEVRSTGSYDDDIILVRPADQFEEGTALNTTIGQDGSLVLSEGVNRGYFLSPVTNAEQFNALMLSYTGQIPPGSEIVLFVRCLVDGKPTEWKQLDLEDEFMLPAGATAYQYRAEIKRPNGSASPSLSNIGLATSNYNNGYENEETWSNTDPLVGGEGVTRPNIISRSQWGAKSPRRSFSTNFSPKKVVIHHTAGSKGRANQVRICQSYHQNSCGWSDIGYHYLISHTGEIFEGRPDNVLGTHVAGANKYCVGISAMGHYSKYQCDQPCWNSLVRLTAYVCSKYRIQPKDIIGHKNMANKDCPGKYIYSRLDELRQAVQQLLE